MWCYMMLRALNSHGLFKIMNPKLIWEYLNRECVMLFWELIARLFFFILLKWKFHLEKKVEWLN